MTNENDRVAEIRQAADDMERTQAELRRAGQANLIDPTPENQEAADEAEDAAREAAARSRRLTGGSQ